jgi:ferredoxin--NADP+ reductase
MSNPGTDSTPLRVAIIGSGPAGFYAAERLFKEKDLVVEVDLYDRLPTPFGLVRGGVAPDHPKIKSVTKVYDRTASNPNFRFYGNVEFGADVTIDDLRDHYHQIVYCTGAQTDRSMRIPGEDLKGSHPATEFVAWYNGHPDFRDHEFDLSQESAAVVGIGNVAMDVARILCRTKEELAETDIADYALEELGSSNIKEVYILGRRGPAQAKYTNPEIKELGEMKDADIVVLPEEAQLGDLSQAALDAEDDRTMKRNVEIAQEYAGREPSGKSRKLMLRFLVSPVELIGGDDGQVVRMKLVKNELYESDDGSLRPRATEQFEELPVGLVFRSVGYRGVPLKGVPFRDDWGTIPNVDGRVVTDPESNQVVVGEYTSGWIKRGPSGVIGTNKADSVETVEKMLEDVASGAILSPSKADAASAEALVKERQPRYVTYADWLKLDELEMAAGEKQDRPRVKFTTIEEMLGALGR